MLLINVYCTTVAVATVIYMLKLTLHRESVLVVPPVLPTEPTFELQTGLIEDKDGMELSFYGDMGHHVTSVCLCVPRLSVYLRLSVCPLSVCV
jgi:hypothetical protein